MIQKPLLYKMYPVEKDFFTLNRNFDCFFVAAGSDHRAYEVLKKFKENSIGIKKVVVFDFEERSEEKSSTYNDFQLGFVTESISCSIKDPWTSIDGLIGIADKLEANSEIAIDISCFSKPYFAYIIKYLKERGFQNITAFYTEPMTYMFPHGWYQSFHSTDGALEIVEIPGFPGDNTGTQAEILVVLFGFDGELADFIVDSISPERIVPINGFPAYSPSFKDISIVNNEILIRNCRKDPICYASANNPFDTFNCLEQIKTRFPEAFISIAAVGTKPMALGACLFAALNPSVRLIYPLPEKYSNITTTESSCSWGYELPLNI